MLSSWLGTGSVGTDARPTVARPQLSLVPVAR